MMSNQPLESPSSQEIPEGIPRTEMLPTHRKPTHPGEMLRKEFLEPLEMSQRELAERMGVHYPRVNELVNQKRGVTPETAALLAKIFHTSERFWLGLQWTYDLWEAHQSEEVQEKLKQAKPVEPDTG